MKNEDDFYRNLPPDLLSAFHYEIQKKIKQNILTRAMEIELTLIDQAAKEKGILFIESSYK
ncbi:hypothetical protein GLW08_10460 [Pontibacillus yanchengensis]|uniref:Uncharacterized protein n=1 Tax=Pontibacillus yanchengensis TaxID=462910 RepID=A0ACC7VE90_9BACI|nr:hypothetical protein [Pontibacillus yanchengensis]MYL53758.1 hypothetical protein [Pontibacillus yanchengensis]